MNVHECIRSRRSMRKYQQRPVEPEKLERVLAAIQWAPSWVNLQPWEVIIVDEPALKEKLQQCVPESNPGRKALQQAPLLLVMCGRQGVSGFYKGERSTVHGDWVMFDLGIACQNLCLAAWAEGLGTLHLGLLDHNRAGQVLELPEDIKVYEIIPLGYPAKEGTAPKRRPVEEFVHRNGW